MASTGTPILRAVARAGALLAALGAAGCTDTGPVPVGRPGAGVLFLTGGGYHDFAGNAAVLAPALQADGWRVHQLHLGPDEASAAQDLAWLEAADLPAECSAILVYTQGELGFSEGLRARLLAFVEGGGGLVGLHSAADSHPGWAAWDQLLGGRFETHPPFGPVTVAVDEPDHPVTKGLPLEWQLADEFYHLKDVSMEGRTLLMSGVSPAGGARRPVTTAAERGRGRVVYTILGHGPETHGDPRFQRLVSQALSWVTARR